MYIVEGLGSRKRPIRGLRIVIYAGASMSVELEAERRLIVALDMPDAGEAYKFWQRLALPNAVAKIGLELLFSGGVELVRRFAAEGGRVFVDAKLFDIGNTVERATARVAALGATFLTVHAQDPQTVAAAVRGRAGSDLKLLGIMLLTSAAPGSLGAQGIPLTPSELVLRRASFAAEAGFDGVVSSPLEAPNLKANFAGKLAVVCPGIRPRSGQAVAGDDQARAATPGDALRAGADYIVVGRPIAQASDPAAAARAIIAEMAEALAKSSP
jgi:orotidine-5'-phosphate decarboxylase